MLKRFFKNQPKRAQHIKAARSKLCVERLEDRRVFAGLLFDSVLLASSETASAFGTAQAVDSSGNTYMGGHFSGVFDFDRSSTPPGGVDVLTSIGGVDAFVAKYSPSSQLLWVQRMGGSSSDYIRDMKVDSAGNIYLGGNFANTADFGATTLISVSGSDSFVAKLDANGSFLWAEGSGDVLSPTILEIAIDQAGNLTTIDSAGPSATRQWAIRQFDTNGNPAWNVTLPAYTPNSQISVRNVVADANGNLYFSGSFLGTVDLDPGLGELLVSGSMQAIDTRHSNSYLLKLASNGSMEWAVPLIAVDTQEIRISELMIGEDGNLVFTGGATGPVDIDSSSNVQLLPSGVNSFFAKMSSTGGLLSVSTHPGTSPVRRLVAFQGKFYGTGTLFFEDTFNPSPEIMVTGYGRQADNNNAAATGLIVEYDQAGTVLSAGRIGGIGGINGVAGTIIAGISVDSSGQIYVTGSSFYNHTDYDPSPVRDNIVLNPSNADAFRLKLKIPAPTKFFVVNDAWTDKTYEYTSGGSAIENYSLGSGNTAPRGAASRVAGDKLWVVDANRKVYSYNDSGAPLGSWTAGTLATNAIVEGIATNGTDVWIVDNKTDRVYRYSNAAGLTTGSQNAVSSFALNGSNTNPKDIVTDGTHLWVVNDSTTDKVFKYTLTGSLVGSWTIDSANQSPTGITLDPSGVSQNLWIVDSGSDRVYEYSNARGNSSGNQAASVTFALAAGNTNPQGIADPPPSATRLTTAVNPPASIPVLPASQGSASIPLMAAASSSLDFMFTTQSELPRSSLQLEPESKSTPLQSAWSRSMTDASAFAQTEPHYSVAKGSRRTSASDHDTVFSNEVFGELETSLFEILAAMR